MMLPQLAHNALLSGDVDYHGVADSALRLAARGAPIKTIFFGAARPNYFLIAKPQFKSIQELRGKYIGIVRFGDTIEQGNHGGTGIGIYKDWLYAETNDRIVRYALPKDGIAPAGAPETIVSGLPLTGDHPMHPFAIDAKGNLFVDVATATNSCQAQNRMPNVPGDKPCTELETRAGIWRYDANRTGQRFTPAEMFEARRSLEMAIAALAAERATGDQMASMSEEITGMFASLDEPEQFLVHDMRFHQTVAAASGNRILTALMNMVATILFEVRSKTVRRARDLKESAEMHRKIYRAIRDRNSEAARDAMRDHLMLAQKAQEQEEADAIHQPSS